MGLLKAVHGAMGSVLEEQWKEFFYCDALDDNTLLVRGFKHIGKNSANRRRDDDVLTNGSLLCVADGQCVLVVRQGKVIDVCREPGEHVFSDPEQGGVKGFFREVGKRVAFGGGDIQPVVHRVYYLNVKEITGVEFQSAAPIPFRVKDGGSTLDLDSGLRLAGCLSYRVSDPVKLYKTIIGNVKGRFTRNEINSQVRADLMACLPAALGDLAERGLRPYELTGQTPALCDALRERMNQRWCGQHGLELVSVALSSCVPVDGEVLQSAQYAAALREPQMAGAVLSQAAAAAIPAAARNAAGSRAIPVAAVAAEQREAETPSRTAAAQRNVPASPPVQTLRSSWKCVCGTVSDRKFCPDCGKPRPAEWVCACGQRNDSRFCRACGTKRPDSPQSACIRTQAVSSTE